MKKTAMALMGSIFAITSLFAQLPTGSVATDFNVIDINGNQHHLYSYLNQGKTVILDFSAAWCPLCLGYHNTKALENFYTLYGPGGSDEAMVLFIEKDINMGLDDLMGNTSASAGDFVTGTSYPIIDTSSLNADYRPDALPTIYGVHPDRILTRLNRPSTDELLEFTRSFEVEDSMMQVDSMIEFSIASVRDITCNGETNGAINIEVSGPATSFTYLWSNAETTQDLSDLPAGQYSCRITDNLGNTFNSDAITVAEPDVLTVDFLRNTPSNSTATDGSIIANVSGGIPPYSYVWNDGTADVELSDVGEGDYSVQVTDANGCEASGNVNLNVPTCALFLAINIEPTTCNVNADGQVNILVERAQGTVIYEWNTGDTTQNLNGLVSGGYEVTVTDGQGCSATAGGMVIVDDPISPIARIRSEVYDVYLGVDGTGFLSPQQVDSGSFDNCAILGIQLSASDFDCTNLGRNFVEFAVIDEALNMSRREIEVTVLDTVSPRYACLDTMITVRPCNGVVNYAVPQIIDNCPEGSVTSLVGRGSGRIFPEGIHTETYNYVSSDGSRASCSIDINVRPWVSADVMVTDASCAGENDGAASVLISNGQGSYQYRWSNGQSSDETTGLRAGNYNVSVTDTTECSFDLDFFVGEPVEIFAQLDSIAEGTQQSDVFVSIFGGTPPYRYTWVTGGNAVAAEQDPEDLPNGLYTLKITDDNGCMLSYFVGQVGGTTAAREYGVLQNLRVIPNPNRGDFFLDVPTAARGRTGTVTLFNTLGQQLEGQRLTFSEQTPISTSLQPGLYILEARVEGSRSIQRVQVQ